MMVSVCRASYTFSTCWNWQVVAGFNFDFKLDSIGNADDYVEYLLNRLAITVKKEKLPSLETANEAFYTLGNRPEEILKALRQLLQQDGEPDVFLPVMHTALGSGELCAWLILALAFLLADREWQKRRPTPPS